MINSKIRRYKFPILFLVSVLVVLLSFYFRADLIKLGSFGLIGIFLINILGSATLFIPAPAIASVIGGGIIFNPLLVAIVAALGSAIGDMIGFALGRSGKEFLFKKGSLKYNLTQDLFNKFGPFIIVIFAFIPNPVFDAIGLFAGIFTYPALRFFVYTLFGRFLRNLLLAYVGASF